MSNTGESKQTHALHVVLIVVGITAALAIYVVYVFGRVVGFW